MSRPTRPAILHAGAVLSLVASASCFGNIANDSSALSSQPSPQRDASSTSANVSSDAGGLGAVRRGQCPEALGPGASGTRETTLLSDCEGMAADDKNLYLACGEGILCLSKSGGDPVRVAEEQDPRVATNSIAIDDEHLYWSRWAPERSDGEIVRMPKAGGPIVSVVSHQQADSLVVDADSVYWIASNFPAIPPSFEISSAPLTGGTPRVLVTSSARIVTLVGDGAWLYYGYANETGNGSTIARVAKSGASPEIVVATEANPNGVGGWKFALAGDSIGYRDGSVVKVVPVVGGAPRTIAPSWDRTHVAAYESSFFFTTPGKSGTAVRTWQVGSTVASTVAETSFIDDDVFDIVADASRVYWLARWLPPGKDITAVVRSVER